MTQEELKRALESSKERRDRRVDALLRNPDIKAAVHRDQHPRRKDERQKSSSQAACAR
jgi:hypothetical protein